ncbi:MAG: serine hydrolase domain-containing protein [Terriglobales bacterium]
MNLVMGAMKKAESAFLRRTVAALITVSLVSTYTLAENSGSLERRVEHIFADVIHAYDPGATVLIRKNGHTVFQHGFGVKDLRTRETLDVQTNFRLASCTKQFTAMSVMLLVHDGNLRYNSRLTDIFPDFPEYGKSITIRSLLNHTSGLPDYEELMDQASSGKAPLWTETHQITDEGVLTLLKEQKSGNFLPGTKWSYSNSGYVVLGLVVAHVSGKPFDEFLHDRIFGPLKMNHTVAYVKGKNEVPARSYGHTNEGGTFKQTDQSSTSATLGDGGVYSNLEDLIKWDEALTHHTLLTAKEMEVAMAPVKLRDGSQPYWASGPGDTDPLAGKPVSYGFGWFLDPYRGHPRMWHYGETIGFKTAVERFPNDNLTIIVLCNRSDLDAGSLALKAADLYLSVAK